MTTQQPEPAATLEQSRKEDLDSLMCMYDQKNLFSSSVSVELDRIQKVKKIGTRLNEFGEQQKLLAEKELRIEELLQEMRSYKHQANSLIGRLHNTMEEVVEHNKFLLREIDFLKAEEQAARTQFHEKQKVISQLILKVGALQQELASKREGTPSKACPTLVPQQRSPQIAEISRYVPHEASPATKIQLAASALVESMISYPDDDSQKQRQREELLQCKEILKLFATYAAEQLPACQEHPQSIDSSEQMLSILPDFFSSFKRYKLQATQMAQELRHKHAQIDELEKIIDAQQRQREELKQEKIRVCAELQVAQQDLMNCDVVQMSLKKQLGLVLGEKQRLESELAGINLKVERERTHFAYELERYNEAIRREEQRMDRSRRRLQQRSTDMSDTQQELIEYYGHKIKSMEEEIAFKNEQINHFERQFSSYSESYKRIHSMAVVFDHSFCSFVDRAAHDASRLCKRGRQSQLRENESKVSSVLYAEQSSMENFSFKGER